MKKAKSTVFTPKRLKLMKELFGDLKPDTRKKFVMIMSEYESITKAKGRMVKIQRAAKLLVKAVGVMDAYRVSGLARDFAKLIEIEATIASERKRNPVLAYAAVASDT